MRISEFKDVRYNVRFPSLEADFDGAMDYAKEFYDVQCPDVEVVEIDRVESTSPGGALTDLWGEQVGGLTIKRKAILRCFPSFASEERQSHRKQGVEVEQDVNFVFCMAHLAAQDIIPQVGDHVIYKCIDYEIVRAYVDPQHLWGMTNRPMYWSCASNIYRPGDRKPVNGDKL